MSQLTTVYKCPDGTDFPVEWEQPEDVQKKWLWEQEHAPDPLKPLEVAIGPLTRPGAQRAFAEAQVPVPALFRGGRIANGFLFTPTEQLPPDEERSLHDSAERLAEREGGVWNVWEGFCLPRIETACLRLRRADENEPLTSLAEIYGYGMRLTHVAGSHSLFAPVIHKFVAFGNEIGVDGERLVADMTQGYENATFASNATLWELADAAGRSPAVRETLLKTDPAHAWDAIRALQDGQEFVGAFEAYLEQFGCRSGSWGLSYPTWREDPASPLRLVRRILETRPAAPAEALWEGAKRRAAVMRDVEARLGSDAARIARFRKLAEPLAYYIPIREARAYWQLVVTGVMRTVLLRRGRLLAERGALAKPDEIFYLEPKEIEAAMKGDAADLLSRVQKRKAEWEFWSQRRPPESIGGDAEGKPRHGDAADGVIRGVAASRGLVTARARVLADLGDADRLQPGEVLVCAMSSPPWTPLFAIAGGVVTDSGGILSHPAIVAREYGIPAVVGAQLATQRIPDGALITVDGTNGIIQIDEA